MIKAVRVINSFGDDPLDLNLATSHEDEGIYIKSITGIGPESSNINTTPYATEDGGVFNSARADDRNIVLDLGFYESPLLKNSIEDSRQKTYKYFPKKKQITLVFYTDNRTSFINGYVESNTPDIFSNQESTQISVICPDPNFYSAIERTYRFGGVIEKFEFPFTHDVVGRTDVEFVSSLSDKHQAVISEHSSAEITEGTFYFEPTSEAEIFTEWVYVDDIFGWWLTNERKRIRNVDLIIGEINQGSIHQILYNGDADTPTVITIHFLGEVSNITLENIDFGEIIKIDTSKISTVVGSGIISGDDIIIDSNPSQKSIKFRRNGLDYDILNLIDRDYLYNCWFKLRKGINQFVVNADAGFDNVKILLNNNIAYNGI